MEIFKGENIIDFMNRFPDDSSCLEYLSELKWGKGYKCVRCGHAKFTEKANCCRVCTKCKHIESPTANTMFHKVKFGIRKAFCIVFEMSATTKSLSSSQLSKRYTITRKTAWLFTHKVRTAMESKKAHPITGKVHVDEFAIGGKEDLKPGRSKDAKKKKVVCAVELDENDKVRRVYAQCIPDYSSKSLRGIFDSHISKSAKVTTDEWTGYRPLAKEYDITQVPSSNGTNFKQLHHIVHQVKSWVRTTYSWIHKEHTDKYLAEYSYRINRSIFKETIFHKLIERMVNTKHVRYKDIIVCT